jgi:DNA-binding CsgD family transcriptional regulator
MKLLNVFLWLAAYSGCLFHIFLFSVVYYRYRNKTELRFLYVLGNLLVITGIIMALHQTVDYAKTYNLILANSLLSFFVTVPLFVYKANAIEKKYYFLIPAVILAAAFVYNFLILSDYTALAYPIPAVFFIILFIPLFLKKPRADGENRDAQNLQRTGVIMFFIVLCFTLAAFPAAKAAAGIPYLFSGYFAVFTLAYQIPGLLYCKDRLRRRPQTINLSQLTSREKEIVREICGGLKYEEIAEKLFVSLSAVKKHTYNIYRKLNIKNNRELMLLVHEAKEPQGAS